VNRDPRRGIGHEKVLTRITVDAQAERLLEQAGKTLQSVLEAGEVLHLRSTGNMSTGGTAIDVTSKIHPLNEEIFGQTAGVIGLDVAGIDVISLDITRSLRETGGGIIEVNAAPGFRMHLQPSEGRRRNVARPVIDMLFPDPVPCRLPMVAITGTNGKTTTSRMVAHILKTHGLRVGLTTSSGIYIDDKLYLPGDTTGPKSARMVLRDPSVEAAVLETARGGILREGLGWDRCDVGAVLNISADHLGVKGVETVEDLARIKSLIVEVVEDDGYSVLNADDPLTCPDAPPRSGPDHLLLDAWRRGQFAPGARPHQARRHRRGAGAQRGRRHDRAPRGRALPAGPVAHEIPATWTARRPLTSRTRLPRRPSRTA
jgi:cyanophycin synthetase